MAFVRGIHRWPVNSPKKFPFDDGIGQVRLGCSVRNYFSVRRNFNSTGCGKLPRWVSSNRGLPCGEIGKWVTWHPKLRPKRSRVYELCPPHHSFILQSPRNDFVNSDMSNTLQLQSSWRWPLWRYRSPQDVSPGHGRCHGDNPWKFSNDVIVWGSKLI